MSNLTLSPPFKKRVAFLSFTPKSCSSIVGRILSSLTSTVFCFLRASAAFFCQKFNYSSVISIEPDVSNREILAANTAGLNVFIFEGALSSRIETRSFIDPNHGEWAYRFCMEDSAGSARDLGEVQCLGIGDILNLSQFKNHKLLIVKLDIEGGESLLFEENLEWLDETPLLVIELHDWMLLNKKPSRSFQNAILGKDFDLFTKGENLFCFNRKILGN